MKRALAAGGCVLALLVAATATGAVANAKPLTPTLATKTFGDLLHQVYGPLHGYWTCPRAQAYSGSYDCLGEVDADGRWHQYGARAERHHGIVDFHLPYAVTWKRRWSGFSSRYTRRRGAAAMAPGTASVNGPAYDWAWLAGCAHEIRTGQTRSCDAYDGQGGGWSKFFQYHCERETLNLVTCRNSLGDAMRYRPHG